MFKATHKRRATTLSKTLLTAGLLGGAALSALGAGSAQAGWFPPLGNPPPPLGDPPSAHYRFNDGPINDISPIIIDKTVQVLQYDNIPGGSDLKFSYVPGTGSSYPWHLDLDFTPDVNNILGAGFLTYAINIVSPDCKSFPLNPDVGCNFKGVNFISGRSSATSSLTKTYGTGYEFDPNTGLIYITGVIDTLNLTSNVSDNGPAFGTVLYVKDTWLAPPPGETIDNLSNEFSQTEVPAPLPLLGVGAAFGSIRKLRKFSSQLKTFSMG